MSDTKEKVISMIAAVDDEWNLAIDRKLPWSKQAADKAYYLSKIAGHTIIMGSTTYGSADHSREGNRIVVISRQDREALNLSEDVELIDSIEAINDIIPKDGETELFITGGGSIYTAAEEAIANRIYLNFIHTDGTRDGIETKFPVLDTEKKWKEVSSKSIPVDENNEFPADFKIFERT